MSSDQLPQTNGEGEIMEMNGDSTPSCSKRPKNGKLPTTSSASAESLQLKHLSPQEKYQAVRQLVSSFDGRQKESLFKELLTSCNPVELNQLFSSLEAYISSFNDTNPRDPFKFLPAFVALKILSFLDPRSLCNASRVCKQWQKLSEDPALWKDLCFHPSDYRLSTVEAESRQLQRVINTDGTFRWKEAFSERFRLWRNWSNGRCVVRTFEGHTEGISCVQFDEDRIVSGSSDNTIRLWDIRTNNRWAAMCLTGHSATVRCLQLLGNRLVSGSNDFSIKVWDLSIGSTWAGIACRATMLGHQNSVRCLQVDQTVVISGSYDRTLKMWDLNSGQCRMTFRGHDDAVLCLKYDDRKIVSGSSDNSIKVWDLASGQCTLTMHNAHADAVTCLQFDDNQVISGSLDRAIKFWDLRTGRWLRTIDWTQHEGHTGVIRAIGADRWRIVSAADDKTLKVWSVQTGKGLVTLKNHTDGVTCLQFNDERIVSGSYDKTVKLWDFSIC